MEIEEFVGSLKECGWTGRGTEKYQKKLSKERVSGGSKCATVNTTK